MRGNVQASDSFAGIGVGIAGFENSETRAFDAISIQSVQKREQVPFRRVSSSVTSPKIWEGAKIFDFQWITLFLGDTTSQNKKWLCVPKILGGPWSPRPPWLHLCKAGTLLHSSTMQCCNVRTEMLFCSKPPVLEIFYHWLKAEYLRYKGACHDSQTDLLDAPLCVGGTSRYFKSAAALHLLCCNFRLGSLGYSELL